MNGFLDIPDDEGTPPTPHTAGGVVTVTTTFHQTSSGPSAVSSESSSVKPQNEVSIATVFGIDSIGRCNSALLANAQSKDYLGQAPQFWGRYFYAPGQRNAAGNVDSHYSQKESAMLRMRNIRVLPIARQTSHVGDGNRARHDATQNVEAIFEVFPAQYLSGADPNVLVFLDVEQKTPMAADYYETWSNIILSEASRISNGRVRFHPAIYASRSDTETWGALKQAMDGGASCDGLWIARYYHPTPVPKPWDDRLTRPAVSLHCPILAWQYRASHDDAPETTNFDTNIANPAHADMLMSRLVMPPGGVVGV